MSGGADPAGSRRRRRAAIALVAAAAGVGGIALLVRALAPTPPRAPPEDPWVLRLPTPVPRGEPVTVTTSLRAGDAFRGHGSFSYVRQVAGEFGRTPRVPPRVAGGTFVSTRRVGAGADGRLVVTVEATLSLTSSAGERSAGSPPAAREAKVAFSFPDGVAGPMSTKEARLEVEGDLRELAEPLVDAFTQRAPLPSRAVRIGESFLPKDALDLEPMRRQVFQLFAYRNRGVAPVEGLVWVEDRVERPAGSALEVRTALHHAQDGPVSEPGKPEVKTVYESVVRGRDDIGVADGAPRDLERTTRRRLRVAGKGFDYRVEVAMSVEVVEERTAGR